MACTNTTHRRFSFIFIIARTKTRRLTSTRPLPRPATIVSFFLSADAGEEGGARACPEEGGAQGCPARRRGRGLREGGQSPPRQIRRGHDGLQEGAPGVRRRHRGSRDVAPQEGAFYTLVPIRPRRRGERRSLRTFAGASLRPPLAFNTRHRCLSTPADAFQLHPDNRSYGTTLRASPPRTRRRRASPRRARSARTSTAARASA